MDNLNLKLCQKPNNIMKYLIGVFLIIVGIVIIVFAFERFENTICHCPMQIEGQPLNCPCVTSGREMAYQISSIGVGMISLGITIFVIDYFKKKK